MPADNVDVNLSVVPNNTGSALPHRPGHCCSKLRCCSISLVNFFYSKDASATHSACVLISDVLAPVLTVQWLMARVQKKYTTSIWELYWTVHWHLKVILTWCTWKASSVCFVSGNSLSSRLTGAWWQCVIDLLFVGTDLSRSNTEMYSVRWLMSAAK